MAVDGRRATGAWSKWLGRIRWPRAERIAATIAGRVDAAGVCGDRLPMERDWTLRLVLPEWRVLGGPRMQEALRLRQRCGREQLAAMQARIEPGRVIVARIELDAASAMQGELVEIIDADAPAHLLDADATHDGTLRG